MAMEMGYPEDQIMIFETGQYLEMDENGVTMGKEAIAHGSVLVDGISTGGVSDVVLRDRRHLSQDGTVIVTVSMDRSNGEILSGPDLMSRGFLHPEDSVEIFDVAVAKVIEALQELNLSEGSDLDTVRVTVHDSVSRYLRKKTGRRPVVIPIIMEI